MTGTGFEREWVLRVFLTATFAGLLAWFVSGRSTAHADFAMLWMALQQTSPYDQEALRETLNWGARYPVAFVHPPSSLPILGVFAQLPFRTAITAWAAVSGAALALASRSKWTPFLLLIPPVLWALPGGQTSVLMGSLLFGALLLLPRWPIASGLALGLALALKPQLAIVLPLAYLVERRWAPLIAAIVTFAALTAVSAIVFGPKQWIEWANSLPSFLALHEAHPILRRNEIAIGLPVWLRIVALVGGVWLTGQALRRSDPVEAFVILVGTALIVSVHAMGYEFAMIAPVYLTLIQRSGAAGLAGTALIFTPVLIWIFPELLAYMPRLIAVIVLMACVANWRAYASQASRLLRSEQLNALRSRLRALVVGGAS